VTLCAACGEDFGGVRAFDAHRVGSHEHSFSREHPNGRRCLTVEEMVERGFQRNSAGRWSLPWSMKLSAETKARRSLDRAFKSRRPRQSEARNEKC
jgi:hypothetical protein